ncbi:hypothetical protein DERP_001125 [Dermatophagoides pteronyssinus]|uniref:Uncharacterized protein n=1 Tax=Dermatophagoides pteronyssinus TaxID=6956 RepID=A0ABQ8JDK6_DERPT|nr:hypothetical protein DERP_001125 [Dermatophagoides pteronyssinus]
MIEKQSQISSVDIQQPQLAAIELSWSKDIFTSNHNNNTNKHNFDTFIIDIENNNNNNGSS